MGTTVRIEGGFVVVDPRELLHAWSTCLHGLPGIGGFRAWLAAREMVARRQGIGGVRTPLFGDAELARLLDISVRTAAASVRRLVTAGLLEWSESAIGFPRPEIEARIDDVLADTIAGGVGPVAIPRRLLRWLAKGARPALIATALGALLRCLSRRRSGFDARGRFKASWIAKVFGIAERHAKDARAELVALGWLEPQPGDQWAWNKWGRAYQVRLDWAGPRGDCHPCPLPAGARSSPPDLHPEPLREEEHPEPAECSPSGILHTEATISCLLASHHVYIRPELEPSRNISTNRPVAPPTLHDVRTEDLKDTGRTLELHRQAIALGKITASEADRIRFVAAVEHAKEVGKSNPPGLLARIVAKGWWHLLTQRDEDLASKLLHDHQRSANLPRSTPSPGKSTVPHLNLIPRSPYATERSIREPSALSDLLAGLAIRSVL
jgi:hypothetical protein